jgi:hypothetical protein
MRGSLLSSVSEDGTSKLRSVLPSLTLILYTYVDWGYKWNISIYMFREEKGVDSQSAIEK